MKVTMEFIIGGEKRVCETTTEQIEELTKRFRRQAAKGRRRRCAAPCRRHVSDMTEAARASARISRRERAS